MAARKIVIIAQGHPRDFSCGSSIVAYNLARGLVELGMQVYFFGGGRTQKDMVEKIVDGPLTEYIINNCETKTFFIAKSDPQVMYWVLNKEINTLDPDIIHFHSLTAIGWNILDFVRTDRSRRILTNHLYSLLCPKYNNRHTDDGSLCSMLEPYECMRCFPGVGESTFHSYRELARAYVDSLDMLTTPGVFAWQKHIESGVVSAEKIRWIPNGTQVWPFKKQAREPDEVLRLVYIGHFSEYKGPDILFEALTLLPEILHKKIHLTIYSDTSRSGNVIWKMNNEDFYTRAFAYLEQCQNRVTVKGNFADRELSQILYEADCLVMPSRMLETRPGVIQEAFMCGRPVICSNIGGMAEMVEDGVDGLHFEVGNPADLCRKIMLLAEDPNLLISLRNGIKPQPTYMDMAMEYARLYEELLN